MSIKPIIFSAPMVRALIEGRKTQTRRLLKPPRGYAAKPPLLRTDVIQGKLWWWDGVHERVGASAPMPYAVGDLLWVREGARRDPALWVYAADGAEVPWPGRGRLAFYERNSMPSIHLPRIASRITLRVTAVKVERLQEISEADAKAEGVGMGTAIERFHSVLAGIRGDAVSEMRRCRAAFAELWDDLHGPGAWEANPFVAALSFDVEQRNVDA